jgi:hypothetical protein
MTFRLDPWLHSLRNIALSSSVQGLSLGIAVHPEVVVPKEVKRPDIHHQLTGADIIPLAIESPQPIDHPQQKTNGEVNVILEVAMIVTRPDRILHVHAPIAHHEVVVQCAGLATGIGDACILREEHGQNTLSIERFLVHLQYKVLEVSIFILDAAVGIDTKPGPGDTSTIIPHHRSFPRPLRPKALGIGVVEEPALLELIIDTLSMWPPDLAGWWIKGFPSHTLEEVIVSPWEVRLDHLLIIREVRGWKNHVKVLPPELMCGGRWVVLDIQALPSLRVNELRVVAHILIKLEEH